MVIDNVTYITGLPVFKDSITSADDISSSPVALLPAVESISFTPKSL